MRITKTYCDHCGQEISGRANRLPQYQHYDSWVLQVNSSDELCDDCLRERTTKTLSVLSKVGVSDSLQNMIENWIHTNHNALIGEIVGMGGKENERSYRDDHIL